MIKVLYFYKQCSPINMFLERQIRESKITKETAFVNVPIEQNLSLAEEYNLEQWHTLVFLVDGKQVLRYEGPFYSEQLNQLVDAVKEATK